MAVVLTFVIDLAVDNFPRQIQYYEIMPLEETAPAVSCFDACGPYPYEMDILTTSRTWVWNDTTPLGFDILNATLEIDVTFCSRTPGTFPNVTLVPVRIY